MEGFMIVIITDKHDDKLVSPGNDFYVCILWLNDWHNEPLAFFFASSLAEMSETFSW